MLVQPVKQKTRLSEHRRSSRARVVISIQEQVERLAQSQAVLLPLTPAPRGFEPIHDCAELIVVAIPKVEHPERTLSSAATNARQNV